MYDASCSTQLVLKPVLQSRQQVLRAYWSNIGTYMYCVQLTIQQYNKLVYFVELIHCLFGQSNMHLISAPTSQEGIECTKAKE